MSTGPRAGCQPSHRRAHSANAANTQQSSGKFLRIRARGVPSTLFRCRGPPILQTALATWATQGHWEVHAWIACTARIKIPMALKCVACARYLLRPL